MFQFPLHTEAFDLQFKLNDGSSIDSTKNRLIEL